MVWASRRIARPVALALLVFVLLTMLLYSREFGPRQDKAPDKAPPPATPRPDEDLSVPSPSIDAPEPLLPLPPPEEYSTTRDPPDQYCASRFSTPYLEDVRDHAASYCEPDASSRLTCMHSHTRGEPDHIDTTCIGQGVFFDQTLGRFSMHCPFRQLAPIEIESGIIPWDEVKDYWYETGPHEVVRRGVAFLGSKSKRDEPEVHEEATDDGPKTGAESPEHGVAETKPQAPNTFILLKREGEGNLWHCMMEIFSLYLTLDALSMTRDLHQKIDPYFNLTQDPADTQVVILDDRADGPYFDLWTLFAKRKPLRLRELAADVATTSAIQDARIVIPLTGSSNPLWQEDEEVWKCTDAPTLSVFSDRVLRFYGIPEPVARTKDDPIKVTFIDRQGRKLRDQDELFKELEKRYEHISVRLVDFATISFTEQITIARETDILVGVHGAGLTHTMFMRYGVGAMVEIQPAILKQWGYRNIAYMRDLNYFRIHALPAPEEEHHEEQPPSKREWHFEDVDVDRDMFFKVMDAAIKSMYTVYPWDFDVNQ